MLTFNKGTEFPALKDTVYLDHAGATLAARSQLEANFRDLASNIYGNPHSRSPSSSLSTDTIDQVRYRVLEWFGTSPDVYSVIFTSGCTGALKLVAEGFDYHGDQPCDCDGQGTRSLVNTENRNQNIANYTSPVGNVSVIKMERESDTITCKDLSRNMGKQKTCYARGSFNYLMDNHTSVQGMREIALLKAGKVQCLDTNADNNVYVRTVLHAHQDFNSSGNHLFAFPAQSNFSGQKYPLEMVVKVKQGDTEWQRSLKKSRSCSGQGHYFTLLDAASLVSTSPLDLGDVQPDFVALSFYKMFGFPTGLGALLVKNDSGHVLKKIYFGGGTVAVSLPARPFHVLRESLSERFEDGTVSFLDIISLRHGFDALQSLAGGMSAVSKHTFSLAQYFHHSLLSCFHGNGSRLSEIYCDGDFNSVQRQGAIVTFNLLRSNGDYIGFSEFDKLAQLYNIHVRTGCFCNIGACQKYLNQSDEQIKHNFQSGHVCGDDRDLVDGRPTGAVRVSFGYMSTLEDAQRCLQFIVDCFLDNTVKPTFWENSRADISTEYSQGNVSPAEETTCSKQSSKLCSYINEGDYTVNKQGVNQTNNVCAISVNFKLKDENNTEPTEELTECVRIHKTSSSCNETLEPESKHVVNDKKKSERRHLEHSIESSTFEMCKGRYLTDIFLYPVKSCAPFKVDSWSLSGRGLLYDREWMIVAQSGIAMSQKREARLCLIQPSIDLTQRLLILDFPGMDTISIPLGITEERNVEYNICNSKVCGDRVQSIDCGREVGDWLSEALGRPGCKLIRQAGHDSRVSKLTNKEGQAEGDTGHLSLANESQYLLISRNSVAELHQKILQRQEQGDTLECFDVENLVSRFRGNLVVNGCDPFEEDAWYNVQIGKVHFKSQGQCTRCQMVCMDQQTGERSKEPLKTLATWRGTKAPFGIHLCNTSQSDTSTILHVGDPVFIS